MPALKIGIQTASLRLPLKKGLLMAARLGARGVEIDARNQLHPHELSQTGVRQIRKMLEDLNLRVCAVGFRTRRGYNVLEDIEQRVEATKQAMDMAYALGAPVVVNQLGHIPSEPQDSRWNLLLEVLDDLGRYGQHAGALLAAETGTESGEDLARLVAAVDSGGIGVNFDPGNLIINGFSPLEAIDSLGEHILHVHAKDGVRDLAQGRGLEVPLGRGTADFPALLGSLEERNYHGFFTIERDSADDPIHEIQQAVKYLNRLG